jgi:hypothetical protein
MLHFEVGARLLGAKGVWEILPSPQVARFRLLGTWVERPRHGEAASNVRQPRVPTKGE